MTKEERKEAQDNFDALLNNPLNALRVYAPFKRLQHYYVKSVHKNIHKDIQRTLGMMIMRTLFECSTILPKVQFGTRESKKRATEAFLDKLLFIISGVEFLVESQVGVSIKQGTELIVLIQNIQAQMGGFKKYLSDDRNFESGIEDDRRNPLLKSSGSEQVF